MLPPVQTSSWYDCYPFCGKTADSQKSTLQEMPSPLEPSLPRETSPKWDAFKDTMPKSVSRAIACFATDWKNQYANNDWSASYVMKPMTWIATPAISAFAAILSPIEGIFRSCISLFLSALATVSPWRTVTINEFNNNYFNKTLVKHVITARVAAEYAFTGIFSPNTPLNSFKDVAAQSHFCRMINPNIRKDVRNNTSYLFERINQLQTDVNGQEQYNLSNRCFEKTGPSLEERIQGKFYQALEGKADRHHSHPAIPAYAPAPVFAYQAPLPLLPTQLPLQEPAVANREARTHSPVFEE